MYLEQPRCENVTFPVTVSDYHNSEAPIAGALVELFQLSSLSAPTLLLLDKMETDAEVEVCKKRFLYKTCAGYGELQSRSQWKVFGENFQGRVSPDRRPNRCQLQPLPLLRMQS